MRSSREGIEIEKFKDGAPDTPVFPVKEMKREEGNI